MQQMGQEGQNLKHIETARLQYFQKRAGGPILVPGPLVPGPLGCSTSKEVAAGALGLPLGRLGRPKGSRHHTNLDTFQFCAPPLPPQSGLGP